MGEGGPGRLGSGTWGPARLSLGAAASLGEELQPDPSGEALLLFLAPPSFPVPLIKSEVHSGIPLPLCPTQRGAERNRGARGSGGC